MCLLAEVRTALALMSALSLMAGCATTQSDHRNESRSAQTESVELNVELLAPNLYDELVIEVDVAAEHSPDEQTLADLRSFAESVVSPARVTIVGPERIPRDQWPRTWTRESIQNLAAANIRVTDEPRQASVYVLYAERQDDQTAAGAQTVDWIIPTSTGTRVVRGMWLVGYSLQHALTTFTSRAALETFVLKHEFGHVLGLVKNSSHESRSAPSHCIRRGCLMETFLDFGLARYLALGLPGNRLPKALCPQCLADLAATRTRAARRSMEDNRRLARVQSGLSVFNSSIASGDLARAIELGHDLGSHYPDNAQALLASGAALSLAGDTEAANRVLARALQLGIDQEAGQSIARLLCALGRYESAIPLIPPERARSQRRAALNLAWALEGAGRYQDAIEVLGAYMESGVSAGERDEMLERRARLMRIAGRAQEALDELNKHAYGHEYWGSTALIELSRVLSVLGDLTGARRALLDAEKDSEHQFQLVLNTPEEQGAAARQLERLRFDALLGREVPADALGDVIASIAESPSDTQPELGMALARVLAIRGDFDGAVEWCAKSRQFITRLVDSRFDPALSDDFKGLRDVGRLSPRFPWCPVDPIASEQR